MPTRSFPFTPSSDHPNSLGMIQHFRVDRLIGEGGMGCVFEAVDTRLQRAVALKLVKPDASTSHSAYQRFLREARLMASIQHDNMVTIFDVGNEGQFPFLAMELLEGETLETRLSRSPLLTVAETTTIARQICRGLRAAHRVGIVHRDIKPRNLWLQAPDQTVKILDFGLARDDSSSLTQIGSLLGTPKYLSPEQARGEPVDVRSDLYSLGVTIYRMLSGQLPHDEATTPKQLAAIVAKRPDSIGDRRRDLPTELVNLVDELLEKDADNRPKSADAVIERLDRIGSENQSASNDSATPGRLRRTTQILAQPISLTLIACGLLPGLVAYPLLANRMPTVLSDSRPSAFEAPSELETVLPTPQPRETKSTVLSSISVIGMRGSGVTQRDFVNMAYQPTYVRETPVFEFELGSLPSEKQCVDAVLMFTLKGGATSSGTRKLRVYAVKGSTSQTPLTSVAQMQEMIDSQQASDLGAFEFANAGYRKNGLINGIRLRSSALIDFVRDSPGETIQLWLWRTDMSNGQTHIYADPEMPESLPKLWIASAGSAS